MLRLLLSVSPSKEMGDPKRPKKKKKKNPGPRQESDPRRPALISSHFLSRLTFRFLIRANAQKEIYGFTLALQHTPQSLLSGPSIV